MGRKFSPGAKNSAPWGKIILPYLFEEKRFNVFRAFEAKIVFNIFNLVLQKLRLRLELKGSGPEQKIPANIPRPKC